MHTTVQVAKCANALVYTSVNVLVGKGKRPPGEVAMGGDLSWSIQTSTICVLLGIIF